MKRARVTTCSEAARARARVSPLSLSPDALLALLDDADGILSHLLVGSAAVASLTADMVTRKDDSVRLACGDDIVRAARAALVHSTKRVAHCARRRARSTTKHADACAELFTVTAKQLRALAPARMVGQWNFVLECMAVGCSAIAPHGPVHVHTIVAVCSGSVELMTEGRLEGCVATGDGLRVVSSAGSGLKWFDPHSRNEFTVVLAQANGSVPVWLTTGDVTMVALSTAGSTCTSAGPIASTLSLTLRKHGAAPVVTVVLSGMLDDSSEVELQLRVCGLLVVDADGCSDWVVRVPRSPSACHECAAVGAHVQTLAVAEGHKYGMAVSADEKWLVVGLMFEGVLSVYSLPGGECVRSFGGCGDGPLQFQHIGRLCFAPNGDLIVVDSGNQKLQEVTLEGVFVRVIGVGQFGDVFPFCVAVNDDVIAVGCSRGTGPRVVLFDFDTGSVTSRFGEVGTSPGRLSQLCSGIRFTPDASHLIVAELDKNRVSLFTTSGVFVRCVVVGVLGEGPMDVLQSMSGEYVVSDYDNHRVCVLSPDGSELVRSWGRKGTGDGLFQYPTALAAAGRHLYVMDDDGGRVHVFE